MSVSPISVRMASNNCLPADSRSSANCK